MKSSNAVLCAASLGIVVSVTAFSSQAWANTWMMAGVQSTSASTPFTEVVALFQVPPAPTDGTSNLLNTPIDLYPGLMSTDGGCLFQPVLQYSMQNSVGQWTMHNEMYCTNSTPVDQQDTYQVVKVGDYVEGYVLLDSNNLGPNCNPATGSQCNFTVGWLDWNGGATGTKDFMMAANEKPLTWALGLVFELPPVSSVNYTDCGDFPGGGPSASTFAEVSLSQYLSSSNRFSNVPTNFTRDVPPNKQCLSTGVPETCDVQFNGNGNWALSTCQMNATVSSDEIFMTF